MYGSSQKITHLFRCKTKNAKQLVIIQDKLKTGLKEYNLKNSCIIFIINILLFVLCGCFNKQHNTPYSLKNKDCISSENNTAPPYTNPDPFIKQNTQPKKSSVPQPFDQSKNNICYSTDGSIKQNNKPVKNFKTSEKIQAVLDEALDYCQVAQEFWQKGELENAVESLDKAYSLILSINASGNPELLQQKEDLRYMISKRILEIYASRNIVANGNYNEIPITINKYVQSEINKFTKNEKKFFIASYKRSGMYRKFIVSALKKAGLPEELSWLPLIESGFKVNALSKARALGLWQFIPSTGYKFGLKRNMFIDERLDPYKSTMAAIKYLKALHNIFGDWATVLAAYNCGENRVLRIIRNQNINYLDNFWDLYERLPRETSRYVPRFLATLEIVGNPSKYNLDSIAVCEPFEHETVTIAKQIHLKNIAKTLNVSQKILKAINPELRYSILPSDDYRLKVPPGKGSIVLAKLNDIPVSYPPRKSYIYHKIRRGETLSTIARKYHTSSKRIARANNLNKHNLILAGKTLKIPRRGTITQRPLKYNKQKSKHTSTHLVKSGDSLWIIAKYYGTTTKKIYKINNLSSTKLHIGQVLKIPKMKKLKISRENLAKYQVKNGDSPFTIAKAHNMSLERFLSINNLVPRSKIYPAQILYLE